MRSTVLLAVCLLAAACHNAALGPEGTKPCDDLTDRASCEADPSCLVAACPACAGQDPGSIACYTNGAPPPQFGCPAGCVGMVVPATDCGALTTQATCDAESGCYSVLTGAHPQACNSVSCSVGFDHCTGATPVCAAEAVCPATVEPCPPPYSNVYDDVGCVAGCVEAQVCS